MSEDHYVDLLKSKIGEKEETVCIREEEEVKIDEELISKDEGNE